MKTFIVKVRNKKGKIITIEIEAKDRQQAINECKDDGMLVVGVEEQGALQVEQKKASPVKGGYICTQCGNIGDPKTETKGSIIIEIVLWLCFLIPGLIYSIWRLTSRYKACKLCNGNSVIPINSPVGMQIIENRKSQ